MATPIWNEKQKRWRYRVYIDGEYKAFYSSKPGLAGKREAMKKARSYEDDIDLNPKLSEEWERFKEYQRGKCCPEQMENNEIYWRFFADLHDKRVESVKLLDYQRCINNMLKVKDYSKKYVKNVKGLLVSFLKFMKADGIEVPDTSMLYVPQTKEAKEKEILQPEQIRKLFEFEDGSYWYLNYYKFLLLTGLRPGEALGLKWSDYEDGTISIKRSINNSGRITEAKNKNAHRTIVLPEIVRLIVQSQQEATKGLNTEWIFPNIYGDQGSQRNAYKYWMDMRDKLGSKCSLYGLRHTFISMMKNDIPEQMLKAIVGHSTSMDTFGVYGHKVSGESERAAKIIDISLKRIVEAE